MSSLPKISSFLLLRGTLLRHVEKQEKRTGSSYPANITGPSAGFSKLPQSVLCCWVKLKDKHQAGRGGCVRTSVQESEILWISAPTFTRKISFNARDQGLMPGLGRFPEEGNGYPLQYSCLEKFHGQRSLADYIVHGVTKSQTQLND